MFIYTLEDIIFLCILAVCVLGYLTCLLYAYIHRVLQRFRKDKKWNN